MTKLEQITELLVNELKEFGRGIERLERLNEGLRDTTVQMDLTELKSLLEAHKNQIISHQRAIEQFERRFDKKIREAKVYPDWAVLIFIVCVIVSVGFIFYETMK